MITTLLQGSRPAHSIIALVAAIATGVALGQEEPKQKEDAAEAEAKEKAPDRVEVTRGFKAQVEISAMFEPENVTPISIDTEEWTDLVVADVVPHGKRVNEGDVILRLETEKLEEQIEALGKSLESSKLALRLARAELENVEETTPLQLRAARDAARQAAEDLAHFEDARRDYEVQQAERSLESAKEGLDYEREELEQLEKMYEADDLTEETEEIILKRARNSVRSAEFRVKGSELNTAQTLETQIPRSYRSLKTAAQNAELAEELARASLPNALEQKQLSVEKAEHDVQASDKKLANLRRDADKAEIEAPADGYLYYGVPTVELKAKASDAAKKLVLKGKLTPHEPVMALVEPGGLFLSGTLQEKDLAMLKPGSRGSAAPVSSPVTKLPAKIVDINYAPLPSGGFSVKIEVEQPEDTKLMPGMTANVIFEIGNDPQALTIPLSALFVADGQTVVYVTGEGDSAERREVKCGATDGKVIVIEKGLEEGESLLTSQP